MDGWMDSLVGTGVATALRIVQWISNWNCNLTFLPKLHITCSLRCHPNKSVGKLGLGWLQTLKYCSIDKKKICGFISFFGDQSRWLFESLWWNWALDEKYFPADICSPPSQKEIFLNIEIFSKDMQLNIYYPKTLGYTCVLLSAKRRSLEKVPSLPGDLFQGDSWW